MTTNKAATAEQLTDEAYDILADLAPQVARQLMDADLNYLIRDHLTAFVIRANNLPAIERVEALRNAAHAIRINDGYKG